LPSGTAASDTFVVGRVADAEAIFFAGRDQGRYLRLFGNTPLEDAVNASASRGVPVGGTSSGLAVLGELGYSA
jgi:cyanophycinase-like exopeptidase